MKRAGKPRTITDEQLRLILEFKRESFKAFCGRLGVNVATASEIRRKKRLRGWVYKRDPERI